MPSPLLPKLGRNGQPAHPSIPIWLKVLWTAWVLVWAPLYGRYYGAQNFLFYCDIGNLLITAALWLESRLIFSWQAVGLLVFQTLYAVDLLIAFFFGTHVIGGTEYLFDPHVPLVIRLFGLYHIVVPVLLLWSVRRLSYDRRGWIWATVETWIVVPISFFWRPQLNVNWARGLGHEQHLASAWIYLAAYLIVVPLLIYWPTHFALERWAAARRN